ncbi:hypothetical protein [Novosphingobium sp. PhB165]|nr:hypothetical protein [Novosphingobium sp. PhB165]
MNQLRAALLLVSVAIATAAAGPRLTAETSGAIIARVRRFAEERAA